MYYGPGAFALAMMRDPRVKAVAAPAAVIRMLVPRRGVVPTWVAPVLAGPAFCDFSEAVTGCGASSVAAVVVGAVAVVVASDRCGLR